MKRIPLFSAIFLLSWLTIGTASAQNPRDIFIKFEIDAAAIFDGGDVEEYSEMSDDNNGGSSSGKPSDFESEAYISKFVNWEIDNIGANPNEFQVKFLDFPWTGPSGTFKDNPIKGGGKKAKAKIEDNAQVGVIKYTIRFTIRNKVTGETRTFELDPKIRVV
ncbi:hypothetical protein [Algoriphagus litoralis]|uniref:hypothetical protein n=1 Tax=Algoriphagus litoralis TaxID=2202829 RepID=UPI000DBA1177|nr:hypothetical protein [Algoriphagus litoralis]